MKVNNIKCFIKRSINWKRMFLPRANCLRNVGLQGPAFIFKAELCQQTYFIKFYINFAIRLSVYKLSGLNFNAKLTWVRIYSGYNQNPFCIRKKKISLSLQLLFIWGSKANRKIEGGMTVSLARQLLCIVSTGLHHLNAADLPMPSHSSCSWQDPANAWARSNGSVTNRADQSPKWSQKS